MENNHIYQRDMKNVLIAIMVSFLALTPNINAAVASESPAIDMVSYEQTWLDREGTIALKNNTSENIHNITFVLEFLDMKGNPLDYETFSYNIDIAPGMTKKLNIPAYEHSRHYHYYKTKDEFGHPAFKLRYELKDYNTPEVVEANNTFTSDDLNRGKSDAMFSIIALMIVVVFLGIYVGSYVLVAVMAQRRNRNPIIWLLLSFIATPLLICIILLAIGTIECLDTNHNLKNNGLNLSVKT